MSFPESLFCLKSTSAVSEALCSKGNNFLRPFDFDFLIRSAFSCIRAFCYIFCLSSKSAFFSSQAMGSSSPNNSVDSYIRKRTSSDLSGKKSPSIGWSEESSRHSGGSSTHRGKSAEVPSSGIDRREISAVRDRVPSSSRDPTVVPSLRDDTDSDGAGNRYADDERESADENVSGESRKNEMVDLRPTTSTRESVGRTTDFCLLPGPLTIRIPRDTDRPSDCPEGFICLFEGFFTETGLRFPIPTFSCDSVGTVRLLYPN